MNPPRLSAVSQGIRRPLVSVMIPTYRPDGFLAESLRSVLAQAPGASEMQIAICDDASPSTNVQAVVDSLGCGDRVQIFEHTENIGLAGNWNRCLEYAQGQFVHLLHQDDVVRLGLYDRLLKALQGDSRLGMAFCRHAFIDDAGRETERAHRERWRAGELSNWLERISEWQRIQCPAVIVRRSVYEALGGFRPQLSYALDWDMWIRIAAKFAVWYEPEVLACYRRHSNNETARLRSDGRVERDVLKTIVLMKQYLPAERSAPLMKKAYSRFVQKRTRWQRKAIKNPSLGPLPPSLDSRPSDGCQHFP